MSEKRRSLLSSSLSWWTPYDVHGDTVRANIKHAGYDHSFRTQHCHASYFVHPVREVVLDQSEAITGDAIAFLSDLHAPNAQFVEKRTECSFECVADANLLLECINILFEHDERNDPLVQTMI